jgi:membrane protein YdbS with pleckstrin-like domain
VADEGAPDHIERAAEWIYRGVWKWVSSLFKVPAAPPELPSLPGDTPRSFHPSRAYLRYLKLYFWIGALAIDVLILLAWLAILIANPPVAALLAIPALGLAVLPDILAYVAIHLKYDTMWYVMNARSLRCRRGIWTIVEHTITFENVQNVDIRRGPIQHFFGIWTIVIETAGAAETERSSHFAGGNKAIMEGITSPEAIRNLIMERVRRSRGTGIGELPWEERPAATMWTPAHIDVLREIRADIRAIFHP